MQLSTRDKIIQAAIELVGEKGYKGATTKDVAKKAGINEVTIFRHFGNKRGLLEAAIAKYANIDSIELAFQDKIVWEIEQDFKMIANAYQLLLEQKRSVILLSLKEAGAFPELNDLTKHIPQKYIELLEHYLKQMQEKGNTKKVDISLVATNFIFLNFGYFLLKTRISSNDKEISLETFLDNNIQFFIQTLQ